MKSSTYADRDDILKALGFDSYAAYLASTLWSDIRKRIYAKHGTYCKLCNNLAWDLHHLSYDLATLAGKHLTKIVPICRDCHTLVEFWPNGQKRTLFEVGCEYSRILLENRRLLFSPEKPKGRESGRVKKRKLGRTTRTRRG